MKKILKIHVCIMLTLLEPIINGADEGTQSIAIKNSPTKAQINEHNANVLEKMDLIQPIKLIATKPNTLYPVTVEPSEHTANFIDTINGKGGISFGKNQSLNVSSSNGSKAKITTDNDGKIVKTVVTHPTTSEGFFGYPKTTHKTTIEYHDDGTHTIQTSSTLHTSLLGPKHNYTDTTKIDSATNTELSKNNTITSASAFGQVSKEINLDLHSGDLTTKHADGSYKKEATEPYSRSTTTSFFDQNGNLQKEIIADKDGKEISHTTKIVNHKDGSVTRYIENPDGTKTVRLTNQNGQIVTEETTDPKNNNRLIKRISLVGNDNNKKINTFEINHKTNEATYTTINHDGGLKSRTTNANNTTIKSVIIDKDGIKHTTDNDNEGELQQYVVTDSNNNKIKETVFNKDARTTTTTTYDKNVGKPTSIETIHEENVVTGQKPYTTTQLFTDNSKTITTTKDSHGNVTLVATTDIDPLNAKSVTTVEDANGALIKTVTVENKNTDQETHTTIHNQGSIIAEKFNAKGIKTQSSVTSKHLDGTILTHTITKYDNNGDIKHELVTDKEGNTLTETEPDEDGTIVTSRHDIDDHRPLSLEIFNPNENTTTIHTINEQGNPVETHINHITGKKTEIEGDTAQNEKVTKEYDNQYSDEHQHLLVTSLSDDTKKLYEETIVNNVKTIDKYSSLGVKKSTSVEGPKGEFISHTEYQEDGVSQPYDKNGNPLDPIPDSPRTINNPLTT